MNDNISMKKYSEMDQIEKNDLVKQYLPLINKICMQQLGRIPLDLEEIRSAAYEGFLYAAESWDESKGLTFLQWAAWGIKNYISQAGNRYGNVVKFSAYNQRQAKEKGLPTFCSVSISSVFNSDEDDDASDRMACLGTESISEEIVSDQEIMYILFNWIDNNISKRSRDIFYHTYGVHGYEKLQGKEISEIYGISSGKVSISNRKTIEKIRGAIELSECISSASFFN